MSLAYQRLVNSLFLNVEFFAFWTMDMNFRITRVLFGCILHSLICDTALCAAIVTRYSSMNNRHELILLININVNK